MIKHSHHFLKRLMIMAAAVIAVFGLSSCTKSFCTNQDKANQLYAYYGDIFEDSTSVDDSSLGDDLSGSGITTDKIEVNTATQNSNRSTLFSTLITNYGYSLPTKKFNAYMSSKVKEETSKTYQYFTDGTLDNIKDENQAKIVAHHVAMYAGITISDDGKYSVAEIFTNFNNWYEEGLIEGTTDTGIEKPGVLYSPSSTYVSLLKSQLNTKLNSNTACITPVSQNFNQNGSTVYIQGKTWGQAFSEYGFLEGLFVWPLSFIVHSISSGLGYTAAAILLAIFVVTLLVRSVTVISTIISTRSQARQAAIQPQLNALQKKYPNNQTDLQERQAMAKEQSLLFKKNKVHPFLPMLFMIIQFPLFICIWSALQGSAALTNGDFLGLYLTTVSSSCFLQYSSTPGAIVGIIIFIVMTVANVLSSATSLWFNSWRQKKFGTAPIQANPDAPDPSKTSKYITYGMMVFIIIMGWSLPSGMGIYWTISALISIIQTVLMEVIHTHQRHALSKATGDGSSLAAMRRSKHHQFDSSKKMKKDKKSDSDKPLWR